MPEQWIERGIGETRVVQVVEGAIVAARILRDDIVLAGTILAARLIKTGRLAVARAGNQEYLLPKGAHGVTEGATLTIEVTREALAGAEPWKRPLARVTDAAPAPAPAVPGLTVAFPSPSDALEMAGWSELLDEARSGIVAFPGGELRIALTPAMTLIDVDGHLPPEQLALAGAAAAARTIRRHGITGSIGIDLPTIGGKAARQAVAEAVDAILPAPFERTAMNGFGFLQIVRPRRHASLFELAADCPAFEARALLRRAARETGAIALVAHPALIAALKPEWLDQLGAQIGGAVTLRPDPACRMASAYVHRR
ncbi:MAG: ribonuclease [Sphingomonas bacterium]|nr:ribonuclease [Sphingomonas bacterium]